MYDSGKSTGLGMVVAGCGCVILVLIAYIGFLLQCVVWAYNDLKPLIDRASVTGITLELVLHAVVWLVVFSFLGFGPFAARSSK